MKVTVYILIVFALGSFILAQTPRTETMVEIKTVAQCRSYREAWNTSVDYDTEHSSARLLYNRAEQLITCAKDIDRSPLEPGMTMDETMKAVIAHSSYAILAATYYQTAFNRATWFLSNKHLTNEFITADVNGKIVQHK